MSLAQIASAPSSALPVAVVYDLQLRELTLSPAYRGPSAKLATSASLSSQMLFIANIARQLSCVSDLQPAQSGSTVRMLLLAWFNAERSWARGVHGVRAYVIRLMLGYRGSTGYRESTVGDLDSRLEIRGEESRPVEMERNTNCGEAAGE